MNGNRGKSLTMDKGDWCGDACSESVNLMTLQPARPENEHHHVYVHISRHIHRDKAAATASASIRSTGAYEGIRLLTDSLSPVG